MKAITRNMIFAMFVAMPISAQRADDQGQRTQSKHVVEPSRKVRSAVVPACAPLATWGDQLDKLYGNPVDEILAAIDAAGVEHNEQKPDLPVVDGDADPVWDKLIDCANQTHNEPERAEALRVMAMWESWRADSFAKQQRKAQSVDPDSCDNLDQLRARVKAVTDEEPSLAITRPMPDYDSTLEALGKCMNDSVRVSKTKPDERYWSTVTFLSLELWEARRSTAWFEQEYTNTSDYAKAKAEYDTKKNGGAKQNEQSGLTQHEVRRSAEGGRWREELADPSVFIVLGQEDRLERAELSQVSEHNRKLCDQVVTVAGLTPKGLALYIPPEGQRFMTKHSQNYPRMCLVQDTTNVAPGAPRYLLVWAYSEGTFAGFQPVVQTTATPASGSGTVTNLYGETWNFTYSGTETEIDTVEAPYVIQTRSLYLRAYDEKGTIVSQHSITTSSQVGGDPGYAVGYNAAALISRLWNNPSRLIKDVLKDVRKDSMKYDKN